MIDPGTIWTNFAHLVTRQGPLLLRFDHLDSNRFWDCKPLGDWIS